MSKAVIWGLVMSLTAYSGFALADVEMEDFSQEEVLATEEALEEESVETEESVESVESVEKEAPLDPSSDPNMQMDRESANIQGIFPEFLSEDFQQILHRSGASRRYPSASE